MEPVVTSGNERIQSGRRKEVCFLVLTEPKDAVKVKLIPNTLNPLDPNLALLGIVADFVE